FRIELDGGGGKRFPIERRARDLDLESVQDQLPNWFAHVQLHGFCSGKGAPGDVGRDSDRVFLRHDLLRKFSRRGGEVEGFLGVQSRHEDKWESGGEKKTRSEHPSTKQRDKRFASRFPSLPWRDGLCPVRIDDRTTR